MQHTIELSARMAMNASLVPDGAKVADVGCDHGYVSLYLASKKACKKVIAMDINEGPLSHARKNIEKAGLSDCIDCRLSDGMQALNQGEVDTVLIAGMGGMLVCRILEQSPEVIQEVSTLVIQAQSDLCEVRKMIHKIGFFIEKEKFCMDAAKPYLVMRAVRGEEKTPYEPAEYEYGRLLPEVLPRWTGLCAIWFIWQAYPCRTLLKWRPKHRRTLSVKRTKARFCRALTRTFFYLTKTFTFTRS